MKKHITTFFPSLNFFYSFSPSLSSLLLTFLTLFITQVATAQIPSNGLVGYWPFNGNAIDASGNGNNGTVNGATLTTDRFGNANSAYSFNGAATISVPHNPQLGFAPTDAFSVSFWFYTTSNTFPQHFMGKRPNNTNVYNWQFRSGNDLSAPEYSFGSGLAVNSYDGAIAYQNLDVAQWVQLVGVYSNGNWKLFRNGVQIDETLGILASNDVVCNLLFGNSGNAQPFTGKLDDISIYNRALTPAEITELFTDQTSLVEVPCTPFLGEDQTICAGTSLTLSASSSALACPALPSNLQNGLVGYWPFCGNANDASGNGNSGTVNGATLTTDRFGNANTAYNFDGVNDFISTPVSRGQLTSNFSISIFERYDGTASGGRALIGGSDPGNGTEFFIGKSGGNLYWGIQDGNYIGNFSTNGTAFNSLWHHIVIVKTAGVIYLYRNGNLEAQGNFSGCNDSEIINFGNEFEGTGNFWKGILDDIIIYSRSLNISEIQQLYALGQTTYLWSNGATTPTINVSPTSTSTYTCTVSDSNGNTCTDSVTVAVGNPEASITPNGIVEICQGESIALAGNGGVSYLWNTSAPAQSITVNTEAIYTVTVTDQYGCTDTESQLVKVNALPDVAVNSTTICEGESAALAATGGLSYEWSPAIGLSSTTGTSVSSSPATSSLYSVVGTDENGCVNSATAAVTVNVLPTATIIPATTTTFCEGSSVVLNGNIGSGLSYQWYNNASAITGETSSSYTATATGSYTVVVTNASSCSRTSNAVEVTTNANFNYFADIDGDGFGNPATLISTCVQPQGFITDFTDCNDNNPNINIAAVEVCNQIDDNCNGLMDDGLVFETYYADNDGDLYGDISNTIYQCLQPNGFVINNTDCNDNNPNLLEYSVEICNSEDDDCDGNIDNGLVFVDYFADIDGDGYGNPTTLVSTCLQPQGFITDFTDCNDNNSNVNTAAVEVCNQIDDNCNGLMDDGLVFVAYYADIDGDGYGNPATLISTCLQPQGFITDFTDCNDNNSNINSAAVEVCNQIDDNCNGLSDDGLVFETYYADNDGDLYGDVSNAIYQCLQPNGFVINNTDCNDNNPNLLEYSVEICNSEDDDCDGNIDNGLVFVDYFADIDGDGFGNLATLVSTCLQPQGFITDFTDCNDNNSNINSAAVEVCNQIDDDCNGLMDDGLVFVAYYADIDGDGFGNPATLISACLQPQGFIADLTDCNDNNSNVNTAAVELCNQIDDDCNGSMDDGLVFVTYYADIDGDGFGNPSALVSACVQPQGFITDFTDCNDNNSNVNTAAVEVCNQIDDDCNGSMDDGLVFVTYYADIDGDGFGNPATLVLTCLQPQGFVTEFTDCNDNNSNVNTAAVEICNQIDDDCNGSMDDGLVFITYYADIDGDGYGNPATLVSTCLQPQGFVTEFTDCNDNNSNVNTAAVEICNQIDDDCNGSMDDGLVFITYYADIDGDGYGNPATLVSACVQPPGFILDNTDCDDLNDTAYPGAVELCNAIDDDCDGLSDTGVFMVYFIDNDGDSYGNPSVSILTCSPPVGYIPNDNDCNDNNAAINPSAEDIIGSGIDENCDGQIDNSIFELSNSINLYPNPVRSELNIQIDNSLVGNEIFIFNVVGNLVYKQQLLSTQNTVSVSNLENGNYIVRVGELVKRFVVEK